MNFSFYRSFEILTNTPLVLVSLFSNIGTDWNSARDSEKGWSLDKILSHLILDKKTDWVERTNIILFSDKKFEPSDMVSHIEYAKKKTTQQLLNEFKRHREEGLSFQRHLELSDEDLVQSGIHLEFEEVSLKALLSA